MNENLKDVLETIKESILKDDESIDSFLIDKELWKELLDYITSLQEENKELKFWLNDVIFDDNNNDVELPARYLRKLGYIDFDDEKQVYTNKHNNEPFWQKEYKEKVFSLKDDELDDYTKQLEFKIKILATIIDKSIEYSKNCLDNLTTIDEEEAKPFKCIHNNYLKILNGDDEE